MTWDYIDDESTKRASGPIYTGHRNKKVFEVQLCLQRAKYLRLTKKEWKELQLFIERKEFFKIEKEEYENLSPKVVIILDDWLAFQNMNAGK